MSAADGGAGPRKRSAHRRVRAHRRVLGLHAHDGPRVGLLYLSGAVPQAEIQGAPRHLGRQRVDDAGGARPLGVVRRIWIRGRRRATTRRRRFWKMISGVLNERERREIGAAVDVVGRAETSARAAH